MEGDVFEIDPSASGGDIDRIFAFLYLRLAVEDVEDSLAACRGDLHILKETRKDCERRIEQT